MDTTGLLAAGLNPLQTLWYQFVEYLPQLLAAIIILAVGWAIGYVVGDLVRRFVHFTGADAWAKRMQLNERMKIDTSSSYSLVSGMIGTLAKALIILAAIGIAGDTAGLPQVGQFVQAVFAYIPNVLVASAILIVGFFGAQYAHDFVAAGVSMSRFPISNRETIATIIKYAIIVFAIMAALTQLRIVPDLIEILFAGLVLALALAFGLGGRDHANDAIRKLREQA